MVRATLRVRRHDPQSGSGPQWRDYEVELPDGSTVLEALMQAQDEQDGTLAFRRSCRHAICGSCGMRVNGCSTLACKTQLATAAKQAARMAAHGRSEWKDGGGGAPAAPGAPAPVLITPLGNMPVVKDLVTDMDAFWRKMRRVRPWLFPPADGAGADQPRRVSPQEWDHLAQGVLCLECGSCYSECSSITASPEFIGPTALVKGHRYAADPRDAGGRERLADLGGEHGLWECMRCYFCTQRCPKNIRVRDLIAQLGAMAVRAGLDDDPGARHAAAFIDSLHDTGRLDESRLGPRSRGLAWAARRLPLAVRAVLAGRMAGPPRTIDDHETLLRVMLAAEREARAAGIGALGGETPCGSDRARRDRGGAA